MKIFIHLLFVLTFTFMATSVSAEEPNTTVAAISGHLNSLHGEELVSSVWSDVSNLQKLLTDDTVSSASVRLAVSYEEALGKKVQEIDNPFQARELAFNGTCLCVYLERFFDFESPLTAYYRKRGNFYDQSLANAEEAISASLSDRVNCIYELSGQDLLLEVTDDVALFQQELLGTRSYLFVKVAIEYEAVLTDKIAQCDHPAIVAALAQEAMYLSMYLEKLHESSRPDSMLKKIFSERYEIHRRSRDAARRANLAQ